MRLRVPCAFCVAAVIAVGLVHAQAPRPGPSADRPGVVPPAQRPPAQAGASATGTGIIRGRVLSTATGQPLRGAFVSLFVGGGGPFEAPAATTDQDGRYELKALPPGRYLVHAEKAGYVTLRYGQRRGGEREQPLELVDGQVLERIDVSLPPGGAIAGQVLDDAGEPLAGAIVLALRPQYVQGVRQFNAVQSDVTDDLGQFRVFGLAPGSYFLRTAAPALGLPVPGRGPVSVADSPAGVSMYYPGTLSPAQAVPVRLAAGGEVSGLSFAIVPVETATISGTARTAEGGVPAGTFLTLQGEGGAIGGSVGPDGTFRMPGVPPGRYTLIARASGPAGVQVAVADVAVAGADLTLALTLTEGAAARGRITFDAGAAPATLDPSVVRVSVDTLSAVSRQVRQAAVQDDWSFEVSGLAGEHRLRVTVPQGWMVRSLRHAGREVSAGALGFDVRGSDVEGIVVELTQRIGTIAGLVSDGRGQTVGEATVIVFAEDRSRWEPGSRYLRAVRPGPDGRFTVDRLLGGRYLVVALDFLETGEETNPETLERLRPLATGVALGEGESRTLDLRVVPAP